MLTLLNSMLSSTDDMRMPSPLFYAVPLYTWAHEFLASLPDFAIVDTILALWTAMHIFFAVTIVTVGDAFYKKSMIQLHYKIVNTVEDIPLLVTFLTLYLCILTAYLCYIARKQEDSGATLRAVISAYTLVCSIILQKLSKGLAKLGPDFVMEVEQKIERHDIANFQPPPKWVSYIFAPLYLLLRPEMTGFENIPTEHPALYVSNHALFGIEMPLFVCIPYILKNIFFRGITDRLHFGQLHGEFLRYFGGVNGTRDNVDCLMETRQNILVYPGGGHEVMKPSTIPRYQLMWKERLGFAKMAIKHGYPIVPCASVGTEDMIDTLFDIPLDFYRKDLKLPVIAPILPHRLQKEYFWFGEPIPTSQYKGDWQNDDNAREVRDKVKAAVEAGIRELQEKQANDPNRYFFHFIANMTKEALTAPVSFFERIMSPSSTTCTTKSEQEEVPQSKKAD